MKYYTINLEGWIRRNEKVMEMLKDRVEFKKKIKSGARETGK
jgi:hypothetical protein